MTGHRARPHIRADDPVSDVLRAIRVSGAVVLHDTYRTPWAVTIPASRELSRLIPTQPADRVVAFHYVEHGWVDVADGHTTTRAGKGDWVIALSGEAHELRRGPRSAPHALAAAIRAPAPDMALDLDDSTSRVLCGLFVLRQLDRTPLLRALPPMAHVVAQPDGLLARLGELLARESEDVGYSNQPAFTRAFRRHYGLAPRAWRERAIHDALTP